MPGPVLGLGTDTKKVSASHLRNGTKVVMERSANINENSKAGMTDSLSGFGVEESWGPDHWMNGRRSRYKRFQ